MNRREWLALTGSSLVPPAVRAQKPEVTKYPFGYSLYGMKLLPLEDALAISSRIGYDGVELALLPGYPTEPSKLKAEDRVRLRKQLADRKLDLLGLMENLNEPATKMVHQSNLDRLKAAAELAQALAPDRPPPIETILGGKPGTWDDIKTQLVDHLGAWATLAEKSKTVIAVKPHVSNAMQTPAQAVWLMKQVKSPWLRLAYDFSHFRLQDLKLSETLDAIAPYAAFIHIKDAKGTPAKFEFLLPGSGDIDYAALLKHLRTTAYRGPIVIEVSGQIFNKKDYDPAATAKKCYADLEQNFADYRPAKK
jgi:inosose dehydratase